LFVTLLLVIIENRKKMRRIIVIVSVLLVSVSVYSADNKDILWLKSDSSYYFIDNSKKCWYTIEIKTDTFFQIQDLMFFARNRDFQIKSLFVDGGTSYSGAVGDNKAEEKMLEEKMKWEYKYQKENIQGRIRKGQELYYNTNNKPFLIWWIELPKKSNSPTTTLSANVNKDYKFGYSDTTEVDINVTHSLYIDFIIHGNNSTTVSFSVLENEKLEDEIRFAKEIANTLNVYGGYIDLQLLKKKTSKIQDYYFEDSLKLMQIQFPSQINVLSYYRKQSLMVSFPEKQNICNAATVLWKYRTDSTTFEQFITERRKINQNRGVVTNLCDSSNIKRDFYIAKNPYFHCQDVYMQSDSIFCFMNFTATESTYVLNIELFNELVKRIKIK
jgi:hypothetical protein